MLFFSAHNNANVPFCRKGALAFLLFCFTLAYAQTPPTLERHCPEDTVYRFCYLRISGPLPDTLLLVTPDQEARPLNRNDVIKMLSCPQWAAEAGIMPPKVVFRILIDEHGYPLEIHPIEWPFPVSLYANTWLPTLAKLRFAPALRNGKPIVSRINFMIKVHLSE